MDWLTTLRALWAKLTGPKTAKVEVESMPELGPGDTLVLYMPADWSPKIEERERWLDGVREAMGPTTRILVLPPGARFDVLQGSSVTVNNTVGRIASPEELAAIQTRRMTGEGL